MKKLLKDKKIDIYTMDDEGTDEIGNPITEWVKVPDSPLWAYFRQVGGNEYYAAAAINVEEDVIFIINWRDDINTFARVVYKGKEYEITRIDPYEGYKTELKLYCNLVAHPDIV